MKLELISGTGGVVRFPTERRARPTLLGLRDLAPRDDLAAAMAEERAGDERAPDTKAEAVEAFSTLFTALEFSMGQEAALAQLRRLIEVQVEQAHALCWAYRDAEAVAEEAEATLRAAREAGAGVFADGLREQVRRTRAVWTQQTLAARAAADVALGGQAALDWHEHGTPWQRTDVDNGDWLIEMAEARERQDEPV